MKIILMFFLSVVLTFAKSSSSHTSSPSYKSTSAVHVSEPTKTVKPSIVLAKEPIKTIKPSIPVKETPNPTMEITKKETVVKNEIKTSSIIKTPTSIVPKTPINNTKKNTSSNSIFYYNMFHPYNHNHIASNYTSPYFDIYVQKIKKGQYELKSKNTSLSSLKLNIKDNLGRNIEINKGMKYTFRTYSKNVKIIAEKNNKVEEFDFKLK